MLRDREFLRLVGLVDAKKKLAGLPDAVRVEMGQIVKAVTRKVLDSAKAKAPVRAAASRGRFIGYAGGALRRHLAMRYSQANITGMVGINRVAIVVRKGRAHTYRSHYYRRADSGRRQKPRVMSERAEARLREGGSVIIRPGKYGHLIEFGTRARRGRGTGPMRSFLRSSVRLHQGEFEGSLRQSARSVERLLASQPGGAS